MAVWRTKLTTFAVVVCFILARLGGECKAMSASDQSRCTRNNGAIDDGNCKIYVPTALDHADATDYCHRLGGSMSSLQFGKRAECLKPVDMSGFEKIWSEMRTNRQQGEYNKDMAEGTITITKYFSFTQFNQHTNRFEEGTRTYVDKVDARYFYSDSQSPSSVQKAINGLSSSKDTCGMMTVEDAKKNKTQLPFSADCFQEAPFVCTLDNFPSDLCNGKSCNGQDDQCMDIFDRAVCDDKRESASEATSCNNTLGFYDSGSCFVFHSESVTWTRAIKQCNDEGGVLAEESYGSQVKKAAGTSLVSDGKIWNNKCHGVEMNTATTRRTDASTVTQGQSCGVFGGKETPCTDKLSFVCRYPEPVFPCQNGATAVSTGEEFKCDCRAGFSGEKCEQRDESLPTATPNALDQSTISIVAPASRISSSFSPVTKTASSDTPPSSSSIQSSTTSSQTTQPEETFTTGSTQLATTQESATAQLADICKDLNGQEVDNACFAQVPSASSFADAAKAAASFGGCLGSVISQGAMDLFRGKTISILSNTTIELDPDGNLLVIPHQDPKQQFKLPVVGFFTVISGPGKCTLLTVSSSGATIAAKECNDSTVIATYVVEFSEACGVGFSWSSVSRPTGTVAPSSPRPGTADADACPSGRFVNGVCYIYLGEVTFDDASEKCAATTQQIEPFLEPALLERVLQTFNVTGSPEVGTGLKIVEYGVAPDQLKTVATSCDGTGCATITLVNSGYDIHGKLCIEKHLYFCSGNMTPPVDLSQCATKARKCNLKNTQTCDPTTKKCICNDPWKGPTCDETLLYDYCMPNPCRFNAACTPSDEYGFVCQCMDGYSGKQCDVASSVSREPIQIYNNVVQSIGDVWVIGTSGAALLVHLAMYDGTPEGTLKRHQLHALLLEHAVIVLFRNPAICGLRAIHCRVASAVILYFRGAHSLLAFFHSLHIFYILSGATGEGAWGCGGKWWLFLSLGWGTPLISSGLLYFLQYDQLGTGFSCMLDWDTNVVYCLFALLPVAHLSMFKLAQARIGEKLRESRTGAVIELDDEHKQLRVAKIGRLGTMLVVVLAPLSYGFASLAVFYADWIYYTVAFVVNLILGTSILVAYIVRNPYVRTLIKSKWRMWTKSGGKRTRPDEATLYGQTREAWIE